ncbi:hypothetical protein LSAT2_032769 [Lamellibrachia satsuma]|nr:hypothetical protein LSAT2_032769 [Lamellibrachia satsuma]
MVIYVHRKQTDDKMNMREGVIKDYERQQMKKLMNVKYLQEQEDLTKVLRAQRKADMKRKEEEKRVAQAAAS